MSETLHLNSVANNNGCLSPTNALGASSGTWTTNDDGGAWECRWALDDPGSGALSGAQQWEMLLRKSATGGNDPTLVTVELYEGASFVETLASEVTLTDGSVPNGQVVDGTFDGSQISDASQIHLRVVDPGMGGMPAGRRSVQVESATVEVTLSQSITLDATLGSSSATGLAGEVVTEEAVTVALQATLGQVQGMGLAGSIPEREVSDWSGAVSATTPGPITLTATLGDAAVVGLDGGAWGLTPITEISDDFTGPLDSSLWSVIERANTDNDVLNAELRREDTSAYPVSRVESFDIYQLRDGDHVTSRILESSLDEYYVQIRLVYPDTWVGWRIAFDEANDETLALMHIGFSFASFPYDPNIDGRFFSIGREGEAIVWKTSVDGDVWTTRRTEDDNSLLPDNFDAPVFVLLGTSTWSGTEGDEGYIPIIEQFNVDVAPVTTLAELAEIDAVGIPAWTTKTSWSLFWDDFDRNYDPPDEIWDEGGSGSVDFVNGRAVLIDNAWIQTFDEYDIRDGHIESHCISKEPDGDYDEILFFLLTEGSAEWVYVAIRYDGTTYSDSSGFVRTSTNPPFDPTAVDQFFIRYRESEGTIYGEVSADYSSWAEIVRVVPNDSHFLRGNFARLRNWGAAQEIESVNVPPDIILEATVGEVDAQGLTATIQTADQITLAGEVGHQASEGLPASTRSGVSLEATVGDVAAETLDAAIDAGVARTLVATLGDVATEGLAADANSGVGLEATLAESENAGFAADISTGVVRTLLATLGEASALGLNATVDLLESVTLAGELGEAASQGLNASVDAARVALVQATLADAAPTGLAAQVEATKSTTLAGGMGNLAASGLAADVATQSVVDLEAVLGEVVLVGAPGEMIGFVDPIPKNFNVTETTSTTITLEWDAVAQANEYHLERERWAGQGAPI